MSYDIPQNGQQNRQSKGGLTKPSYGRGIGPRGADEVLDKRGDVDPKGKVHEQASKVASTSSVSEDRS